LRAATTSVAAAHTVTSVMLSGRVIRSFSRQVYHINPTLRATPPSPCRSFTMPPVTTSFAGPEMVMRVIENARNARNMAMLSPRRVSAVEAVRWGVR